MSGRISLTFFLAELKNMKHKQIPLISLLTLLIILIIPVAAADGVTVSISDITADLDGTCTAPVVLRSINDYGTGAITLEYDPAIVHVTDVTGSEDSIVVAWNADNDKGEVKIAAWNIEGVSGDIDFAVIAFTATGKSGSTSLTIKVDELITQDQDGVQKRVEASISNGKFTSGTNSTPGFELLQVFIVLGMISVFSIYTRKK